jgi:CRP-like cAMP-binding protein
MSTPLAPRVNRLERRRQPIPPAELVAHWLFSGLPEKAREKTAEKYSKYFEWVDYEEGDLILERGAYGDTAYFIQKGAVEVVVKGDLEAAPVVRAGASGAPPKRQPSAEDAGMLGRGGTSGTLILSASPAGAGGRVVLEQGELFGEISALSRYTVSSDVVALTKLRLVHIQLRGLRTLMQVSKPFKKFIDDRYRMRTLTINLKQVPLFSKLDDDFLYKLRDRVELLSFEPGSVIVAEGAAADGLYLVRGGYVKVGVVAGSSNLAVTYLGKGDYAGEAGLLLEQPWPFTLQALEHVEIVKLSKDDFQELLARQPDTKATLWAEMMRRLKERGAVTDDPASADHMQVAMDTGLIHGESVLLIAPTGGGKTLAGFLPTLVALHEAPRAGIHTLYVSPLKALATDIARNLMRPVTEMQLAVSIETRTGDTPANRRVRQRVDPPNILLTTPESLAVLLSLPDASAMFAGLTSVVMDEVHALAGTKRGDQLALCVARLMTLAPSCRRVGLSATVAHPAAIRAYVGADRVIEEPDGAPPELTMMLPEGELSWAGHMGLDAAPGVMARIREAGMTIVFVNTRAQAELMFQALWRLNEPTLPIALHHGSLEVEQRRRVEAAMADGKLRAVVATSSLDLGIDWGGVDQVIQVGAPKGVSRLLQRVGRANHRMDVASRAILVPANRFEVLECEAAVLGVAARELDGDPPRPGGLDVLAQHLLGLACSAPFRPDDVHAEVCRTAPYSGLSRADFDDVLTFVENGGYALAAYERWRKLFRDSEGRVHVRGERIARQHRMNIGTIVGAPMVKVRLVGKKRFGPLLGEVEESFVNLLRPGDTFMFAGRLLRFIRLHENVVECAEGGAGEPMVPAYEGGRLPLTTNLADRVRELLQSPSGWGLFPEGVQASPPSRGCSHAAAACSCSAANACSASRSGHCAPADLAAGCADMNVRSIPQDAPLRVGGTIRRTGRLLAPSMPVSSSTFPALPPQPS